MRKTSLFVTIALVGQIVLSSLVQAASLNYGTQMFAFRLDNNAVFSQTISGQQSGAGGFDNGSLSDYPEGSCIPGLVEVTSTESVTADIEFSSNFDYFNSATGIDHLEAVTSPLGSDVKTADDLSDLEYLLTDLSTVDEFATESGGSVEAEVTGPFDDGQNGNTQMKKYDIVLKDVPAGETVLFLTCARLSADASEFKGATLSMRLSGGKENVGIQTNQLLVLPSLTIVKQVVGSSEPASSWSFNVAPAINGVDTFQALPGEDTIVIENIPVDGAYSITESGGPSGYTVSAGAGSQNCTFTGSTATGTVAAGDPARDAICVFVNTAPAAPTTGTLTIEKEIINNNGGTATLDNFSFYIAEAPGNVVDTQTITEVQLGDATILEPGTYWVSESGDAGYYQSTFSGACNGTPFVTLEAGENLTCNITNDDSPATITVIKEVFGGALSADDFDLFVGSTQVTNGATTTIDAGTYTVSETLVDGYTPSYSGDCDPQGGITLLPGAQKQCIITNTYNAPPAATGTITVVKVVDNELGGEAVFSDFPLFIGATSVTSGVAETLTIGTYTISETNNQANYVPSFSGACNGTPSVILGENQNLTCTITNTYVPDEEEEDPPPQTPTGILTVVKVVINDNGGTSVVADFPLFLDSSSVVSGSSHVLSAGQHIVSETGSADYVATFSGDCDANGVVTIASGDYKTCTITNDDKPTGGSAPPTGQLIVVTKVINDDGGIALPSSFTMTIGDGISTSSTFAGLDTPGMGFAYSPGAYVVNGSLSASYSQSKGANCSGTLIAGQTVTCVVTYDDIPTGGPSPDPTPEPPAPQPEPEVLGVIDSATDTGPVPQVLGATDSDLPVTGMPAWALAAFLLAAAPFLRRKSA